MALEPLVGPVCVVCFVVVHGSVAEHDTVVNHETTSPRGAMMLWCLKGQWCPTGDQRIETVRCHSRNNGSQHETMQDSKDYKIPHNLAKVEPLISINDSQTDRHNDGKFVMVPGITMVPLINTRAGYIGVTPIHFGSTGDARIYGRVWFHEVLYQWYVCL